MTKGAACAFNDIHRSRRICDFASLPLDGLRSMGSPPRSFARGVNLFGERHLRHVPLSHIDYLMARASLIVEQGRADITCRRGSRKHSVPSDLGRTASPICSGLICGRHRGRWVDGVDMKLATAELRTDFVEAEEVEAAGAGHP